MLIETMKHREYFAKADEAWKALSKTDRTDPTYPILKERFRKFGLLWAVIIRMEECGWGDVEWLMCENRRVPTDKIAEWMYG